MKKLNDLDFPFGIQRQLSQVQSSGSNYRVRICCYHGRGCEKRKGWFIGKWTRY